MHVSRRRIVVCGERGERGHPPIRWKETEVVPLSYKVVDKMRLSQVSLETVRIVKGLPEKYAE